MEYSFDSITEFIDYLDNTPINTYIWDLDNLESESTDYSFHKTNSLNEAKYLCKFGWHEKFNQLIELKIQLEKYIKIKNNKTRQYNYYIGYAPDVKAYLEGNPLSMLNKEMPKRKHIDIYYNSAILGEVDSNQIFNRGAITLSMIEILESMGFSVALNIFTMSKKEDQIHYTKFNLKRTNERLNPQKLFFPLCHPSFLRRLVFRLREETPDIRPEWRNGYGRTCDDEMIRQIIELSPNDIVICQPQEMGVEGEDIIEDANHMFEYVEQEKQDFSLEKIKRR